MIRRALGELLRRAADRLDPGHDAELGAEIRRSVIDELRPPATPEARRLEADIARARQRPYALDGVRIYDLERMPPRATPFTRKLGRKPE